MDNQKNLDQLFRHAKEQNPVVTFSETKERFLSSNQANNLSANTQKGSFLLTKKLIIMIVAISTILISLFLTNSKVENKTISTNLSQIKKETKNNTETLTNSDEKSIILPSKLIDSPSIFKQLLTEENILSIEEIDSSESHQYVNLLNNLVPKSKEEYAFPKLTEEEIKANHKQKKQMLKDLEKFDKKVYAYIPSGTFDYQGKQVSVQSFYMQKTEVTNLEYRTFLFDLLIQGRKDEFLVAKPDQSQWSKTVGPEHSTMEPMEELYFSHSAYNEYPVCNINRAGAELYCKWLSQELLKNVDPKKREEYNDIRLPVRSEWVFSASNEGKQLPYPWVGSSIKNSTGCYLANYKPDSGNFMDDGGLFTVKVNSYFTNEHGLYNMSGNVAEMVYNSANTLKDPGTAGGGWMSNSEELKILGIDPYEGMIEAHPNIGFRVVMTVKKQ